MSSPAWMVECASVKIPWTFFFFYPRSKHVRAWAQTSLVIKPLCGHAVPHFKPVMMSLGAALTPVVIRLPAVYSLTTPRIKTQRVCSVEEMLLVVKVGLHSNWDFRAKFCLCLELKEVFFWAAKRRDSSGESQTCKNIQRPWRLWLWLLFSFQTSESQFSTI